MHYQAPSSIVAYYQQVGRTGRNIPHAVGVLMAGNEDDDIHDYFRTFAPARIKVSARQFSPVSNRRYRSRCSERASWTSR